MNGATAWAPQVGQVQLNSPAFQAGILPNDEIIKINETDIKAWDEIGKSIINTDGALKFFSLKEMEKLLQKQ